MAQTLELVTCHAIAQLRLVAQRKQRFFTIFLCSGSCKCQHLLGREKRLLSSLGRSSKCSIVARVVTDVPSMRSITPRSGGRHSRAQIITIGERHRLIGIEPLRMREVARRKHHSHHLSRISALETDGV